MESRTFLILTGQLMIALAIIGSTFIATQAFKQIKMGNGTIYVKGTAEQEIQSDIVKWQGTISATSDALVQAYEKLDMDYHILNQYFQNQNIQLEDVLFSPISTTTIYERTKEGHQTNKVESYLLSLDFTITSHNISQIAHLAQQITHLLKEGLTIHSYQPQYFYSKIDALKITVLGSAAKDARQRAEELVVKSGSKVGTLRSAHQGVFQITPAFSTTVSDYGEFDTSSIAKKIKAIVTMEYAID
ncbi:MAG: SIMPL domain-containing protein [Parachlamydia sp.]|nr:SIMPL domain-containing protein [Parachlamydia sp.]